MSARCIASLVILLAAFALLSTARAADGTTPLGDPVLEAPTLRSLGVYWVVRGDENRNARVTLRYRSSGAASWQEGMPLFRVERGAHLAEKYGSKVQVPAGAWLFAGSALLLQPDTPYDLKLTLTDPDGGDAERTLAAHTTAEPVEPRGMRVRYVAPGEGGGSGTKQDPFRGLASAVRGAQPGDRFQVTAGVYRGPFDARTSGASGRPIIWRGEPGRSTIIEGGGAASGRAVDATALHDVWFEDLTIQGAHYGIVAHRSARVVIRRCRITGVDYGITATNNDDDSVRGFFIADNVIEGPSVWPRSKGIEDARGIQISGIGHDVCYNRIRGFADAVDTFPSPRCAAIDFHNNDISEMTDDGIEMDYSERNTRCYENRFTNVFQGISVQPIYGGPVYIFRNALYNVGLEPFKMHNSPSGALMLHNTCVKYGPPLLLFTSERVRNSVYRNNLFVGTEAGYAYETTAPMVDCDFDYDGFAGGPWRNFLKWNGVVYRTVDEVKARAPVYRHVVPLPADLFAGGARAPGRVETQYERRINDLRLKPGAGAIDAGERIPGLNDRFAGKAPDLGAYELGAPRPHYGPRR